MPIELAGELYDPYDPPRPYRLPDGRMEYRGGTKLDKDVVYAERFWEGQPKGMKEAMQENIAKATEAGHLTSMVNPQGLDEHDKEKLSAYRTLAREMGYEVGSYVRNDRSHVAIAPITKKQG